MRVFKTDKLSLAHRATVISQQEPKTHGNRGHRRGVAIFLVQPKKNPLNMATLYFTFFLNFLMYCYRNFKTLLAFAITYMYCATRKTLKIFSLADNKFK